jgi:hypothetical protein
MWAEEVEQWLGLAPAELLVISHATDALDQRAPLPRVVVTSFRMATMLRTQLDAVRFGGALTLTRALLLPLALP